MAFVKPSSTKFRDAPFFAINGKSSRENKCLASKKYQHWGSENTSDIPFSHKAQVMSNWFLADSVYYFHMLIYYRVVLPFCLAIGLWIWAKQ